ncbi:MAG: hypothetical protein J5654_04770 [Victivallales bacterium]|nr:hypothetical protein [Victivallales bacterium]
MEADFHSIFSLNDLHADDEAVSEALLQSCRRTNARQAIALCQLGDRIVITLHPASRPPADLRFVHLHTSDTDTLLATLHERWMGGYEPVGLVSDRDEEGIFHGFLLVQKTQDESLCR